MKRYLSIIVVALFCMAYGTIEAQEQILHHNNQKEVAGFYSQNHEFYFAQRKAETWQPYVEDLYNKSRLYKNIAYITMTASSILYMIMHHSITFGHHETDHIEQSFRNLNLICGSTSLISLMFYLVGNRYQNRANQIINQESFSLEVTREGIGVVYKL